MNLIKVLTALTALLKQQGSHNLTDELDLAQRALESEVDAQLLRAIKQLVIVVYAIPTYAAIQQTPAFLDAARIVQLSGTSLFCSNVLAGDA